MTHCAALNRPSLMTCSVSDWTWTPRFSRSCPSDRRAEVDMGRRRTYHGDAPGDDNAPPHDEPTSGWYAGNGRIAGRAAGPLAVRPGGLAARTLARWTRELNTSGPDPENDHRQRLDLDAAETESRRMRKRLSNLAHA